MIHKLKDDYFMVTGTVTRDAQFRTVGDKNTPIASFSINAGKRPDTTTIFVECKAWRKLGECSSSIVKGDTVCVIGKMESREYNGKTYKDINCEWLNVVGKAGQTPASAPKTFSEMMDADTDGDLPF